MEQEKEVQVTKKVSAGRFLKKSLIWVLAWSAVFFIPPYIFIEKQMSELRESGDRTGDTPRPGEASKTYALGA